MGTKYTQVKRWQHLGDRCHYCGHPFNNLPKRAKTIDHRQPISRGGTNAPGNLVACCDECNRTKANMTYAEFLEWNRRGRPNKAAYMREIGLVEPPGPTVKDTRL